MGDFTMPKIKGEFPPRLLVTVDEAIQALRLGRTLFYELVKQGEIETIKIGRNRRVLYSSLEAFIAERLRAS